MKKILLIMLSMLAIGSSAWADYVKVVGYELANGATLNKDNSSKRITTGTATLSSDGKTLTLSYLAASTDKAAGIETNRNNLTIVVEGAAQFSMTNQYGIIIGGQNIVMTGNGGIEIMAKNRAGILLENGSSLRISDVKNGVNISHPQYINDYGIIGRDGNNYGDLTIEYTSLQFQILNRSCFSDLNSVTIRGVNSNIKMYGNYNYNTFNNVNSLTLGDGIQYLAPEGVYFSPSQKCIVNADGTPCKDYIRMQFIPVVKIDEEHFPDPTFREFVKYSEVLNPSFDDYLTQEEIDNATTINISNKNITDLQGLEYFTELTTFDCSHTPLTSLDMSAYTKLENLTCNYCQSLTELNLAGCNRLETLSAKGCMLTELDISHCTEIQYVNCEDNLIEILNYGEMSFPSLQTFLASGNELENLVLNDCPNLTTLEFPQTAALQNLQLFNTGLTDITVHAENLVAFHAKFNAALKTIDCSNCNIQSFYVTNNPQLESLNASNNSLNILKIDANSDNDINCHSLPSLRTVNVTNNGIYTLQAKNLQHLESIDCSNGSRFREIIISNCQVFTSLNFSGNSILDKFNISDCPLFSDFSNISPAKEFTVKNTAVTVMTYDGTLYDDNTEKVVFQNNSELSTLIWNGSNANSFTVSGCQSLETINCSNNKVETLNISNCNSLKTLNCKDNLITGIVELSDFSNLEEINLENNKIYRLIIKNNSCLQTLLTGGTKIIDFKMENCPNLTTLEYTPTEMMYLYVINTGLTQLSHHCTTLQVLEITGNTALQSIDFSNSYITNLTLGNNNALEYIDFSYDRIYNLNISKFPMLKTIKCIGTGIYTLDVTECPMLETLDCNNGTLFTLNVADCPSLTSIHCENNSIMTGGDSDYMANFINSLSTVEVPANLYIYDASSGNDRNRCTMSHVAAAMEKGWTVLYYDGTDWVPYPGCDYSPVPTALNSLADPASMSSLSSEPPVTHNLQGQRVGSAYKGIVIVNGKKIRKQ